MSTPQHAKGAPVAESNGAANVAGPALVRDLTRRSPEPADSRDGNGAGRDETRPRLLFFYSPTSGPSRRVEGFLAQVLQRRGNHSSFQLVRVDADRRPDLVERLRVTEIPTLLVVAEGRVRGRVVKPSGCAEISKSLAPWLR